MEKNNHPQNLSNAERYHFADFTMDGFRDLLRLAKARYEFRPFHASQPPGRFILWRHDVDFSLNAALRLARLEAEEGVRATYFLHIHSEYYNLLEARMTGIAREILSLGHVVGLHFDAEYHVIRDKSDLENHLIFEKGILERVLSAPIDVFSFHNPVSLESVEQNLEIAGLVNVYAAHFQKNVPYISDSNGYWRFKRLKDVLTAAEEPCLHVLTHPEWWQTNVMSPKERVWRCIDGRAEAAKASYLGSLAKAGRLVIDWE